MVDVASPALCVRGVRRPKARFHGACDGRNGRVVRCVFVMANIHKKLVDVRQDEAGVQELELSDDSGTDSVRTLPRQTFPLGAGHKKRFRGVTGGVPAAPGRRRRRGAGRG